MMIKILSRELPESLFCNSMALKWSQIDCVNDELQKMKKIKALLTEIPPENRRNIAFLFSLLSKVVEEEGFSKMSTDNIIVVIGPNLLWDQSGVHVPINSVFSLMIERFDWIFSDQNTCNPLASNFNISGSSLTSLNSIDSFIDPMSLSQMSGMLDETKEEEVLERQVEEAEDVEKRQTDIRSQLKGLRVNRVFTTDFGALSDKEGDEHDNGRKRSNTVTTNTLQHHGNDFD